MTALPARMIGKFTSPLAQNSMLFFAIFLVAGMVLGKLARMALDDTIGSEAGIGDRSRRRGAGSPCASASSLVTLVLIFRPDRAGRPPAAFLTGSQLRPLLVGRGPKGLSLAAAGPCRHHRSPEARAADIASVARMS